MSARSPEKHQTIGCGTIAALSFVAIVWMLITVLAVSRALVVGWPALLTDEGVLALAATSATLLIIVVRGRNEIAKGSKTSCPKCGGIAIMGQFSAWQFILVTCFFPLGLFSLLAGRQPAHCPECDHRWET